MDSVYPLTMRGMGATNGHHNAGGPDRKNGEKGGDVSGCLGQAFTDDRKAEFLDIVRETGRRTLAIVKVGVHRETVRKHLKSDEKFAMAFEEAMAYFRESLVAEAVRRGVKGVDEPVYNRGVRVMDVHPDDAERLAELEAAGEKPRMKPASVRRYSDSLLQSLLKAHLPEFADKQIIKNLGENEDPILGDLGDLSADELVSLQDFLRKVKEGKGGKPEADLP